MNTYSDVGTGTEVNMDTGYLSLQSLLEHVHTAINSELYHV
jgi:hypothetical protein